MQNPAQKKSTFYGWFIVILLFYTLIHTAGNGFYGISVYLPRFMETLNCEAASLQLAAVVWALAFGLSSPLIGAWIQRYGARKVFVTGAMIGGLVMALMSTITQVWHLYLINVVAGVAAGATILLPAQTVITLWFDKYRGRAMALVMMGIGVGGFVVPWLITTLLLLFGRWMSGAGNAADASLLLRLFTGWGGELTPWRGALRAGAVLNYVIVVPPLLLWLRNKPSDVGQFVDGVQPAGAAGAETPLLSGVSAKRALKSSTFRLVAAVYLLQLCTMSGIQLNAQIFAEQQAAYTMDMAWRFMGYALIVTIPTRFLFGRLCDRFDPKYLMAGAGVFLLGGALTLWVGVLRLGWTGYAPILIFALLQGVGIGGNAVTLPILVGRCFGERDFGKILGFVMMGFAVGVIFGAPVMSKIFDETGSFELAFVYATVLLTVAVVLALLIRTKALQAEFSTGVEPETAAADA